MLDAVVCGTQRARDAWCALRRLLGLCLPIILPSWRFFDVIAPAPRIEFAWLDDAISTTPTWQIFRPTPATIPWHQRLRMLWWNAERNESLYLLSCADQICYAGSAHAMAEVRARLLRAASRGELGRPGQYLRYRICMTERIGSVLYDTEVYCDPPWPMTTPAR